MDEEAIMQNQVILIKDYDVAFQFSQKLIKNNVSFATVEAEYGDYCIEGNHATLAHHVLNYRDYPAPCVRTDVKPLKNGVILISHLDLDTLGGIAILEGCYISHSFWSSEAIIDTQGALGLSSIPATDNELMQIYWAWESELTDLTLNSSLDYWDVTEMVAKRLSFLNQLLRTDQPIKNYSRYLNAFQQQMERYLNSCVYEDDMLRVFINEQPMHFQMHQRGEDWIPFCLHYHPLRQTLVLSDISNQIDCGAFMKEVFGDKAGGQHRIGGSPREEAQSLFAVVYVVRCLHYRLSNKDDCHLFFTKS